MHFQLNGSVEVVFKTPGTNEQQSLFFEADEFQEISGTGVVVDAADPRFKGWLDAVQDNVQVRLWALTDNKDFREKTWEISTVRQDVLEPVIREDRITFEFVPESR